MEEFWGYVTAGIGAFILLTQLYAALRAKRSRSWPQVTGKILPPTGDEDPFTEVRYAYEVAGEKYESNRIKIGFRTTGGRNLGKRLRREIRQEYPAGREVQVFYDSDNPSKFILEHGLDRSASNLGMIAAFAFLTAGLFVIDRYP